MCHLPRMPSFFCGLRRRGDRECQPPLLQALGMERPHWASEISAPATPPAFADRRPMPAIAARLTSLPHTQFRKNRHFYLWYDGAYAVAAIAAIVALTSLGWAGLSQTYDPWLLLWFPLACHLQILCSVYIHNATHSNFPKAINRLVGELCGLVVLTRFASWEIIHQRHHTYSDNSEHDPHPLHHATKGYFAYLKGSIVGVERQLQAMYFERFGGDGKQNARYQRLRAVLSFTTSFVLLPVFWAQLLGLPVFLMLFVPASLVGFFHLIHFNWATHNPKSPTEDFRPVNLNAGFFWLGNLLWHGIYMHGNHHKNVSLFDPGRLAAAQSLPCIRPGDSTEHYPPQRAPAAPPSEFKAPLPVA